MDGVNKLGDEAGLVSLVAAEADPNGPNLGAGVVVVALGSFSSAVRVVLLSFDDDAGVAVAAELELPRVDGWEVAGWLIEPKKLKGFDGVMAEELVLDMLPAEVEGVFAGRSELGAEGAADAWAPNEKGFGVAGLSCKAVVAFVEPNLKDVAGAADALVDPKFAPKFVPGVAAVDVDVIAGVVLANKLVAGVDDVAVAPPEKILPDDEGCGVDGALLNKLPVKGDVVGCVFANKLLDGAVVAAGVDLVNRLPLGGAAGVDLANRLLVEGAAGVGVPNIELVGAIGAGAGLANVVLVEADVIFGVGFENKLLAGAAVVAGASLANRLLVGAFTVAVSCFAKRELVGAAVVVGAKLPNELLAGAAAEAELSGVPDLKLPKVLAEGAAVALKRPPDAGAAEPPLLTALLAPNILDCGWDDCVPKMEKPELVGPLELGAGAGAEKALVEPLPKVNAGVEDGIAVVVPVVPPKENEDVPKALPWVDGCAGGKLWLAPLPNAPPLVVFCCCAWGKKLKGFVPLALLFSWAALPPKLKVLEGGAKLGVGVKPYA